MKTKSPKNLNFEITIRFRLKNVTVEFGLKKTWILTLIIVLIRIGLKIWLDH